MIRVSWYVSWYKNSIKYQVSWYFFGTVSVSVSLMIHFGCISIINHWYITVIQEFRTHYWHCLQLVYFSSWVSATVSRIKDFSDSRHAPYIHIVKLETISLITVQYHQLTQQSTLLTGMYQLLGWHWHWHWHWQESRAAARKPRDAASVLFSRSSPTTFLTSIRLAMLRKPRLRGSELQTCWRKTQFNTKSGFKVNQSHVFVLRGKAVRQ